MEYGGDDEDVQRGSSEGAGWGGDTEGELDSDGGGWAPLEGESSAEDVSSEGGDDGALSSESDDGASESSDRGAGAGAAVWEAGYAAWARGPEEEESHREWMGFFLGWAGLRPGASAAGGAGRGGAGAEGGQGVLEGILGAGRFAGDGGPRGATAVVMEGRGEEAGRGGDDGREEPSSTTTSGGVVVAHRRRRSLASSTSSSGGATRPLYAAQQPGR